MQAFSAKEILKRHVKDCFKVKDKQRIIVPKKSKYVKSKDYKRKIESWFYFSADFERILVAQDNGKQNQEEVYTNKCQKHVAWSYGYKL